MIALIISAVIAGGFGWAATRTEGVHSAGFATIAGFAAGWVLIIGLGMIAGPLASVALVAPPLLAYGAFRLAWEDESGKETGCALVAGAVLLQVGIMMIAAYLSLQYGGPH